MCVATPFFTSNVFYENFCSRLTLEERSRFQIEIPDSGRKFPDRYFTIYIAPGAIYTSLSEGLSCPKKP